MEIRNKHILLLLTITSVPQICSSFQFLNNHHLTHQSKGSSIAIALHRKPSTQISQSKVDDQSSRAKSKSKGVYSRPSAAIEKGSGFFVPGLEGSKVRILFGGLVLVLNYINHIYSSNANLSEVAGFAFSEKIATFYGVFLLFQGIVEFAKEMGLGFDGVQEIISSSATAEELTAGKGSESSLGLEQFISPILTGKSAEFAEAMSWVAASYLALTPATHVMLIQKSDTNNETVLYKLGEFNNLKNMSEDNIQSGTKAAIATVYQSKGGRVSIPMDHPAASLLPETNQRCILLQQVDGTAEQMCILVGSDELLATFTKNDLKWLGSLGRYLSIKS